MSLLEGMIFERIGDSNISVKGYTGHMLYAACTEHDICEGVSGADRVSQYPSTYNHTIVNTVHSFSATDSQASVKNLPHQFVLLASE